MLGLKPDVIVLAAPRHTDENRLLVSWRNAPGLKQAKASQFLLLCDPADTIPGPSALATIQKLAQAIRSVRESG